MIQVIDELMSAWRALRRAGWFTLASIGTLALGTAATVAVFTIINTLYLRPLPWPGGERLVRVFESEPGGDPEWTVAPVSFTAWREAASFERIAAFNIWQPILAGEEVAERIEAAVVDAEFFQVLGSHAARGRTLTGERGVDEVVISDELWRTRLGGRSDVIGSSLRLNGRAYTVVGVMPPEFRHPAARMSPQLWAPLEIDANETGRYLHIVARLAPGRSLTDGESEIRSIARAISEAHPRSHAEWSTTLRPLRSSLYGSARTGSLLLFAAAALVLAIACVNVANLTLARNAGRIREFTVRTALGAGRMRMFRQVLLESAWIAAGGAGAGLLLVWLLLDGLARAGGALLPQLPVVTTDVRVILFVAALAGAIAFAFGALPALRAARTAPAAGLREAGRSGAIGVRSSRGRTIPIALEVALTTMLIASLALLGRSFLRLLAVDPGYDAERLVTAEVILPGWRFPADAILPTQTRILERVQASPAVESAAFASDLPFTAWNSFSTLVPADLAMAGEPPMTEVHNVTPDYFATLGIQLVSGRGFDARDDGASERVIIVSRAFVERFLPDRDPIGLHLVQAESAEGTRFRIVGVAEDLLDDGYARPTEPRAYVPMAQFPERWAALAVRVRGDPREFAPTLRAMVAAEDPEIAIAELRSMTDLMHSTLESQRGVLRITALFAVLAFLLAGIGVYGVVAYGVASRIPEIGVRLALGAAPRSIHRRVVGDAAKAGAVGLLAGLALALLAGWTLRGVLFGVGAADPVALLITVAAIGAITLVAASVPAGRAARIPPAIALRYDV